MPAKFKKGDIFFLNTEGFILFQHIGGENGIDYLDNHGVEIKRTEGPKDPRF